MNQKVYNEQKVWGSHGNEDFFSLSRSNPKDLYRSEKFFLPKIVKEVGSCLDVGCACGGFCNIMKSFNPQLRYTGIDIIPKFIEVARRTYKDSEFKVCDATATDFNASTFELVHCSGILHLTSYFKEIVREMYRVSSKYVLCDFRLTEQDDVIGEMGVNLVGQEAATQVLPYYVLNIEKLVDFIKTLTPKPKLIEIKGYKHPPTKLARIDIDKIFMAFFLMQKGDGANDEVKVSINLDA